MDIFSSFIGISNIDNFPAYVDSYNIEMAFVMPFNDPYMLSMDFNVETVHSNMLDIAAGIPEKLCCFSDVDIRKNINDTLNELNKVLVKDEFIGIKLHPTNTGYPFIIAVFRWAVEIWNTILSSPPLLAFVIVGSLVILWGVRKFAVWQKNYFEKHPERRR